MPRVSSRSSLQIRIATLADLAALQQLFYELDALHAELHPSLFRAALRTGTTLRKLLANRSQRVLVGEVGGALVGAAHLLLDDVPLPTASVGDEQPRRVRIDALVVAAAHRRRGHGAALVEACAAEARLAGATELLLTVWHGNAGAAQFYRALGWQPLAELLGRSLVTRKRSRAR